MINHNNLIDMYGSVRFGIARDNIAPPMALNPPPMCSLSDDIASRDTRRSLNDT